MPNKVVLILLKGLDDISDGSDLGHYWFFVTSALKVEFPWYVFASVYINVC